MYVKTTKEKDLFFTTFSHLDLPRDAGKHTQQIPKTLADKPPAFFSAHLQQKNTLSSAGDKLIDSWCASLKIAPILIIQSHHLSKLTREYANIKHVHKVLQK